MLHLLQNLMTALWSGEDFLYTVVVTTFLVFNIFFRLFPLENHLLVLDKFYKKLQLCRWTSFIFSLMCFAQLQFTVEISYFEIYNEKIHDLLAPSKKKDSKKVQVIFVQCLYVNELCKDVHIENNLQFSEDHITE